MFSDLRHRSPSCGVHSKPLIAKYVRGETKDQLMKNRRHLKMMDVWIYKNGVVGDKSND